MAKYPYSSTWGREKARQYADGGPVSGVTRRTGEIRLREAMGGEPAVFGPANRALYGKPLYGKKADDVASDKRRQMGESENISDSVPRRKED